MKRYFLKFWQLNVLTLILSIFKNGFLVIAAMITAPELNALVAQNGPKFVEMVLWNLAAFVALLFFAYVNQVLQMKITQKMSRQLRDDLAQKLTRLDYEQFHHQDSAKYASWLTNDITQIEIQGFANVYLIMDYGIGAIMSVAALIWVHWTVALTTLLFTGLMLSLPKLLGKKVQRQTKTVTIANENFLNQVNDLLKGFDTLFAFNLQDRIAKAVHRQSRPLAHAKVDLTRVETFAEILGEGTSLTAQFAIITVTGLLVMKKLLSVGYVFTAANLAGQVFSRFGVLTQLLTSVGGVSAIFAKYETLPTAEVVEEEKPMAPLKDGFVAKHLNFSYQNKLVLSDQSFVFDLGKKYALIGPSGTGKSTLLNILDGKLSGYQGTLTLNNLPLSRLSGKEIRQKVMYIDQIPYIFNGTIRENLCLGEKFSDEELWQALDRSVLTDQVKQLPKGLDTPLGEGGRAFSGGQRQRLALARGFLRHRQIVLMDEGTASLDEDQARLIEEMLIHDPKLTLIMITHQLYPEIEKEFDGIMRFAA